MGNQVSKVPPVRVEIPGELWPQFRLWVIEQGYVIDTHDDNGDDDAGVLVLQPVVRTDDMPKPGPWL